MLVPVLLLFVWRVEGAYRCTNSSDETMTFTKSQDGVTGRYTAELCTQRDSRLSEWKVDLGLYKPKYCASNAAGQAKPDLPHSASQVDINKDQVDCDHVCYSMDFDLIIGNPKYCYGLKSTLITNGTAKKPFNSYHMVSNNLTMDYYLKNNPHITFINHDKELSLNWRLGIPVKYYDVEISNITDIDQGMNVTKNCTRGPLLDEVQCSLVLAPGTYIALLEHSAPWVNGIFTAQQRVTYDFNRTQVRAPRVAAEGWGRGARWACGGALALAGAAAAALAARRALLRRTHYKKVLEEWRRQRLESQPASPQPQPQGEAGAGGPILLLYAREGAAGARAAAALRALLHHATRAQVLDIFSPEVTALAAPAPGEWVRGALRRADVRVLLLQSPAMALLAAGASGAAGDTGAGAAHTLCPPLLGARAQYRRPHFGDSLLQLALRLAAELPKDHHSYRKYYVAEYAGLPTELFPHIVPYRRYSLPLHLPTLLRDLAPPAGPPAGPPPHPQLGEEFAAAVDQFVRLAADEPDYLMDELVLT